MSNLPWILSEWHAISASSAPIKMDGVLFQDLYSIIDTMMKKKEVQVWTARLSALYVHLSGYENPHHVTVDQMPTKVIDVLYAAWRHEGYKGDLEFFTRLLFTYLEIIQYAELMGVDADGNPNIDKETLIPSVLAVTKYLEAHDTSLTAHDPLMSIVFAGDLPGAVPTAAFYQFLGIPVDLTWDEDYQAYRGISMLGDSIVHAPQEYSIVCGARYNDTDQFMFGVSGLEERDPFYFVYYNWPARRIELRWRKVPDDVPFDPEAYHRGDYDEVLTYIAMDPYLDDWDGVTDLVIPTALVVKRHQMRLAVWKELGTYDVAALFSNVADYPMPIATKGPEQIRLSIARMDRNDPLYSVVAYRAGFDDQQLLFIMDQHSLPIIRTE